MKWSGVIFDDGPYSRLHLALPDLIAKPVAVETLFDESRPDSAVTADVVRRLGVNDSPDQCHIRICFVDAFHAHRYGGPSTHYLDHTITVVGDIGNYDMIIGQDILIQGTLEIDAASKGYVLELPWIPMARPAR